MSLCVTIGIDLQMALFTAEYCSENWLQAWTLRRLQLLLAVACFDLMILCGTCTGAAPDGHTIGSNQGLERKLNETTTVLEN